LQQASQSADAPTFIKTPGRGDTLLAISSASEQTEPASNPQPPAAPTSLPNFNGGQKSITHRGSSPGRIILLLGLVLILLAADLGLFYFQQGNRANTNNGGTTPTTQAFNTTTTVVAAHSNPYPPQSGTLVLNDPLSDNSKGYNWDVTPTSFGTCTFTGGAYDVVATNNHTYHRCGAQGTNFSNFTYEVEVKILTGSCAAMIFRGDFPNYHYYYFHICQDGSYALWLYTQNGPETKAFVESSSSSIHTGLGQSNLMAVVAMNDSITLYVNHQAIYTVHDSTYSQGEIGVAVDNDTSPTEAVFSNAKVWML
jgi:hypothetical protein